MTMESRRIQQTFDLLPDEIMLKIIKMATKENYKCICYPERTLECGIHGTFSSKEWKCSHIKYDHDFIIDAISKVSVRFKTISADKSLWKVMKINLLDSNGACETSKIRTIIDAYLGEDTEGVWIHGGHAIYTTDIKILIDNIIDTISEKSPNMKTLRLEYFCPIFAVRSLHVNDKLFRIICQKFQFDSGPLAYNFPDGENTLNYGAQFLLSRREPNSEI